MPEAHSAAPDPDRPLPAGPLLRLIRNQKVAFLLVGGFNTALSFVLFLVAQRAFPQLVQLNLLFAQQGALLTAFVLHRRFVFRVRGHVLRDFGRFELVQITALLLNEAVVTLLVTVLKLPAVPVQAGVTALLVLFSFFGHRGFSFKRTAAERAAQSVVETELPTSVRPPGGSA